MLKDFIAAFVEGRISPGLPTQNTKPRLEDKLGVGLGPVIAREAALPLISHQFFSHPGEKRPDFADEPVRDGVKLF